MARARTSAWLSRAALGAARSCGSEIPVVPRSEARGEPAAAAGAGLGVDRLEMIVRGVPADAERRRDLGGGKSPEQERGYFAFPAGKRIGAHEDRGRRLRPRGLHRDRDIVAAR